MSTAVANQMDVARLQYELDDHDRTMADLTSRQIETEKAIADAKTRLAEATHTLDEHDRPFRRRGHQPEIAQAKVDMRSLPLQISKLTAEQVGLAEEIAAERAAMARTEQRGSGSTREPARRIVAEIDTDARTRGELAAGRSSALLVAHLGPVPEDPAARDQWVMAAGRIEQHRLLWPIRKGQILGSRPRTIGQDDYAFTHHAVQRAVVDLDQSLGAYRQVPAREAPGIER